MKTKSARVEGLRDELLDEFADAMADVEALLKQAASAPASRAARLRGEADAKMRIAKRKLGEFRDETVASANAAASAADGYVRSNAWTAVGIAAAIGLAGGLNLCRPGTETGAEKGN